MKIRLWIGAVFWFVVGLCVLTNAFSLRIGGVHHPGPSFVFFVAALVLLILNTVDFSVFASGMIESPRLPAEERVGGFADRPQARFSPTLAHGGRFWFRFKSTSVDSVLTPRLTGRGLV